MMYNKLRRRNAELTEKNRLLKEKLARAEAKAAVKAGSGRSQTLLR